MSERRNFTFDDEAAGLLDEHPEDNHSELVRELVKEYYTPGVFDTQRASLQAKKRQLERRKKELGRELDTVSDKLEQIEEALSDTDERGGIEEVADQIELPDPSNAKKENPAIQRKAQQNGLEPAALAEVVRGQAISQQQTQYKTVGDD